MFPLTFLINVFFCFSLQPNPFSQLLKPRPELLAEVAASVNGGQGGPEAIQRLTALFAAAAAAANQNKVLDKVSSAEDKQTAVSATMKVPPISLPSGLPFNPNLLWNLPNPYLPPPSPLESQLKSLPGGLGHDARQWQRDDVMVFLRYCEREFDLDKIDMEKFQMNGELIVFPSNHNIHCRMRVKSSMFLSTIFKNLIFLCSF